MPSDPAPLASPPDHAPAPDGPASPLAGGHLAQAVAARLCHDLAGLSGTLDGVLELAEEESGPGGDAASLAEALELARQSAAALSSRLRLLRAAWGGVAGSLDARGFAALAACIGTERVRLDLSDLQAPGLQAPGLDGAQAQALLNLLMLAAESLPRGGDVLLSGNAGSGLLLRIAGAGAAWPDALAHPPDPAALATVTPRALLPPLAVGLARAAGLSLRLDPDPNSARPASLRIGLPAQPPRG